MGKDFNTWNNLKKQIDGKSFLPLFSEKEIWWCSVGINVGREEDGKNELYERPVLIFKKINKESFVGMPLNSQVKDNDFYFKYFFNDKERIIKINQIKTFSANRLIRRMGKMSEDEFLQLVNQVNKTLVQQDETPFLHGVSQAPFGVSNISIAPTQNLSSDLISFSKQTKLDANEILNNTGIISILEKFGVVRIGGSYFSGLMYGPDLDVEVKCDNPKEAAVKFLNKIVEQEIFQKQEFGNFKKFKRENRPETFIVVCKVEYNRRKWEIEIWFKNEFDDESIKFETKLLNISAEQKLEILKSKQDRDVNKLDKHKLSSYEIYKTVLEKNI